MPLFVSITRLRIRSLRFLPSFAVYAVRSFNQVKRAAGFKGGSLLRDRRWTFWTMTTWEDQESMRGYMMTGAHRAAMPRLLDWCDEASVVHWTQAESNLPSWTEADKRMRENGRASKVRNPSDQHASLNYQSPHGTSGTPIRPSAAQASAKV